ncbi:hypothetical protein [Geobacter benzoatilyticus]|uniref:PEP-CTERM sorting domain-containing protein n=1 Tax=Geobacter benzoatilyticus TaxID=2815309 RepID=A0ABX7Q5A7_9BACT|nr:hypothetical protein [Geobacter benzoatilyticus]QSV46280.1 hypothetical protein JZM60_03100 [Geobacter benzoatilyticus]
MKFHLLAFICLVLLNLATHANATTITITQTGTASAGAVAGNEWYPEISFTITGVGDTANRVLDGTAYSITNDHAYITFEGLGTFEFLEPTRYFVQNNGSIVGFGKIGQYLNPDLYDGPVAAEFATWDMLSSIGPISGWGGLAQWWSGLQTDRGIVMFPHQYSPTTFQERWPRRTGQFGGGDKVESLHGHAAILKGRPA